MEQKQLMGANAKPRVGAGRRSPALIVAATLLICSAVLHLGIGLTAALVTRWDSVLASSPVNYGLTTMGLILGACCGAGAFIAVPLAAATDVLAFRRRSLTFAVVNLIVALAALLAGYWIAVTPAVLSAVAIALLLQRRSRMILKAVDSSRRRRSATVGYVLLVSGGTWGLHNFYLGRSWAGALYIGLLIFGTGTWGGLTSFICLGLLGGMIASDAIQLPTRARKLSQDGPFLSDRRI